MDIYEYISIIISHLFTSKIQYCYLKRNEDFFDQVIAI